MIWFNPFDRREKFFVLLVAPEKVSAVLFAVSRDRSISCEKFWPEFELNRSDKWWPKILPHWTVLAAVSPNLAYTATISFRLNRDQGSHTELTSPELENLLSRGINQEFIKYRKVASQALGTSDLDTVLADSRVADFKIDGHRVHNPVGFSPENLQVVVEITFVHRTLYDLLHNLIQRPNFFFTSLARAKLAVLGRFHEPPFALAFLESPHSSIFQVSNAATGYQDERKEIRWSAKEFLQVFMDTWGVNEDIARDLYDLYQKEQLPKTVTDEITKQFRHISEKLESALRGASVEGKILITSQEDIPLTPKKFSFERVSLSNILEKMGFTLTGDEWPVAEYEQFSYSAPLLDFFSDQGSPQINRWLRRRLHWLGSMNYN